MASSQRPDIARERDAARQQRFKTARSAVPVVARPLFGPPIQVSSSANSSLSQNISSVLGSFDEKARQIVYSRSCIGVSELTMTPGAQGPTKIAFPASSESDSNQRHNQKQKPPAPPPTPANHRPGVFETMSKDKNNPRPPQPPPPPPPRTSTTTSSSSSVAATTPEKQRTANSNRSSHPSSSQDKARQRPPDPTPHKPPDPSPHKPPEHFDRPSSTTHVSKRLFDDNKKELLKLSMPKPRESGTEDLLDNILQEMTLAPPLTAIHTPKKDDASKFPFPTHKPSSHKTSSLKQSTTHKVKRAPDPSSKPSSAPKKPTEVTEVTADGQRDRNTLSDSDSDTPPDETAKPAPPPKKQTKQQPHVAAAVDAAGELKQRAPHAPPALSSTAAVKPPSRRQSRMSLSSIQLSDSSESLSSDTSSDEEEQEEKKRKKPILQPPVEEPEEEEEEEDVEVEMDEEAKVEVVEPETPPEEKSEKRWNLQSFIQVQAPSSNSPPSDQAAPSEQPSSPPAPPAQEPSAPPSAAKRPETVAAPPPSGEMDNMSIINDIIHGDSLALDSFDEEIEIDINLFDADSVRLDTPLPPPPAKITIRTPLVVKLKSPARIVPKPLTDAKKKSPGRGRPPGSKNKKSSVVPPPPPQSKAIKQPRVKHTPKSSPRAPPSSSSSSSSSSDSSDDEMFRPVPKLPSSSGIMDLTAPVITAPLRAKKPVKPPKTKAPLPPQVPAPPAKSSSTQLESLSEVLTSVSAPGLLSPIASHSNLPALEPPPKRVKPDLPELSELTYVDGKPSIMVRLDLSLLGKLAAKVRQRSEAPLPDLVAPSPALLTDPLPPLDDPVMTSPLPSPAATTTLKVTPYRDSSIEEGQDLSSSSDSSSSSSSSEDEMEVGEEKPSTPLTSSVPDKEAISRSEKRLKNEQILSQIMDSGQQRQQPPKQVKIPKRSRTDTEHSSTSKRARRSRNDHHDHRRYRSNSNDREPHEDDRKWDRKHQWRASSTVDDDRWSITSASSHHSDHQDESRHRNRDHDRVRSDRRDSHDRKDSRERHRAVHDWDAPASECARSSNSANTTPTYSRNSVAKDWGAMAAMETPSFSSNAGTPHSHRTSEDLPLERRRESVSMQKHRVAPAVDESLKSSDSYVQEARRLKHLADDVKNHPDKFSKSLMYVESVLSFIQYGTAMEYEHKDPVKIFKVYYDTLNFCRYICSSKSSSHSNCEKKLSVLSFRLQAFLCLKMFKTKKTEAAKLKRVLDDHNKQATTSKQAPSPYQPSGQWPRSNGTPSPMSPQPSPAGSTASMGSVVSPPSCYGDSAKQSSSASSTASAQRIQSVTAQYLQHVKYLSDCHEIWEQTDAAMLDHKDFFRNLDNDCGRLTMQSSVPEIVRYIKVGLHRLKEVS